MAIKQLSYLDIPAKLRVESAQSVLTQLQSVAASAGSTQDQRDFATGRIGLVHRWAVGGIHLPISDRELIQSREVQTPEPTETPAASEEDSTEPSA